MKRCVAVLFLLIANSATAKMPDGIAQEYLTSKYMECTMSAIGITGTDKNTGLPIHVWKEIDWPCYLIERLFYENANINAFNSIIEHNRYGQSFLKNKICDVNVNWLQCRQP
jgi:hypothetical protein